MKYNILASKIIRANTVYQVVASLSSESDSCRFMASISKNGMAITSNEAVIHADQSHGILLKIPPGMVSIISGELYAIYITYIRSFWYTYLFLQNGIPTCNQ